MASVPCPIESRRVRRDLVSFRTALDGPAARGDALVVDISPLGFMARTDVAVAAGDVVALALPAIGPHAARVVWALGGRVGGEFADPIDPTRYARLLAAAPRHEPRWDGC